MEKWKGRERERKGSEIEENVFSVITSQLEVGLAETRKREREREGGERERERERRKEKE